MTGTDKYTAGWLALTTVAASALVIAAEPPSSLRLHGLEAVRKAHAEIQALNAELLRQDSATLTLEHWCAAHNLAQPPAITARLLPGPHKPLPDDLRSQLNISAGQPIKYRRVQLSCGDRVLSEAENWYAPGLLTNAMNHALDSSDIPFGKVAAPLHFFRKTESVKQLWPPFSTEIPYEVLQHRALLYREDGRPFSALIETYTNQVLSL